MSVQCTNCHLEFKSGRTSLGGTVTCERCGSKIDSGYNSRHKGSVGIHPLLAKRYDEIDADTALKSGRGRVLQTEMQKAPEVADEWPKIPGYELIEKIGKGAMGSVYRALHLISRREAAVKILSSELASRDDLVARFEREAAALRSFRHRNVVAIFDSGSLKDVHYYSMEYVVGTTLRKCVRSGALPPKVAIHFGRQMAQALKAAHDRGIIHRDLKPENILIEADPAAKLTGSERLVLVDFGLAGIVNEAADPHPNLTHSRVTMGTVNYMAPEQHVDAKRVDYRTDLYAAGVILYECITGDLPLGRFAMPREKGVRVPPSVDACLIKALARSADERYQSAQAFDDALAAIEEELESGDFEPLPVSPVASSASSKKPHNAGMKFFDNWNWGIERDRPTSLATVFPTKWMTSPPWLRRPAWIAGGVALVICISIGIVIANRSPREVAISSEGTSAIFAKGHFEAPAPIVHDDNGAARAELRSSKDVSALVKWNSESPVWSYEGDRIGYFAKQGDSGHFRRDFSFALSPAKMAINKSLAFSAKMTFDRLVLPVDLTEAQHLAREALGASPEVPAGGVFLVNKKGRRAVGMIVFADGSCGMTEVHRNGSFMQESPRHRGLCRAPFEGKTVDLKVVCDAKTKTCTGFAGGQKISTESVEGISDDDWQLALGCRNVNCLFDVDSKKKG